jgi:uncharacterized protein YheU (UPF0270 family)
VPTDDTHRPPQIEGVGTLDVSVSKPVEVPPHTLSCEALRGVIEEFVTRPGTDYGLQERTLDAKIADVARQLECGDAIIVFDVDAGTTNIVPNRRTPP